MAKSPKTLAKAKTSKALRTRDRRSGPGMMSSGGVAGGSAAIIDPSGVIPMSPGARRLGRR